MYYAYSRARAVLQVVVPLALVVDLVHSFYYVGCMFQERMARIDEQSKRELASSIGHFLQRVDKHCAATNHGFWPASLSTLVQCAKTHGQELPPLSYEVDGMFTVLAQQRKQTARFTKSPENDLFSDQDNPIDSLLRFVSIDTTDLAVHEQVVVTQSNQEVDRSWGEQDAVDECGVTKKCDKSVNGGVTSAVRECVYEFIDEVKSNLFFPIKLVRAIYRDLSEKGHVVYDRAVERSNEGLSVLSEAIHCKYAVPYFVVVRRSALRFRVCHCKTDGRE